MTQLPLQQHLITWAKLTPDAVTAIEQKKRQARTSFIQAALECEAITEQQYVDFLAERLSLPAADPSALSIPPETLSIIPEDQLRKYQVAPFFLLGKKVFLALADPEDILAIDDIRFLTGLDPVVHVASPLSIKRTLDKLKETGQSTADDMGTLEDAMADIKQDDLEVSGEDSGEGETSTLEAASQAPVVKMVNLIIMESIRQKASDIHIEPYEKSFRVRFRTDGELREIMKPPSRMKNSLISRLKIMAKLNIAERRLPQDGRIKVKTPGGKEMEFRVSILPTLFGEKVVMRLLDKSSLSLGLNQLGFEDESLKKVEDAISKPHGMFLVTGPTGSGKTVTLYSSIMRIHEESINISTAEDPVEFSIEGINQVQVQEDIGLTFAEALRSFLRQDPDVILVGEIRDKETAEIAIKAALTGHLVFSTLHTNNAPATISRLLNMGVDGFLVASAVNAIVAQRLLRRLCPFCKRRVEKKDIDALMRIGMTREDAEKADQHETVGCEKCNNVGYKGRAGVYEVLVNTPAIQELILKGATVLDIRETGLKEGMLTMRQSGLRKIMAGMTTVEEVLKVTVE